VVSVIVESVKTIADLKTKPIPNPTAAICVQVLGYYEPGDGGGGLFIWAADSEDKNDDAIIIQSSVTRADDKRGRWKRQYDQPISVKWFGARGDYNPKTAKGGDNDTDAIQAALDVAKRTGIPLYLPPGKYKTTSPLRYHSSNLDADGTVDMKVPYYNTQQGLHIFGAGMQKSILYNKSTIPTRSRQEALPSVMLVILEIRRPFNKLA
jgi:hypothetical protein